MPKKAGLLLLYSLFDPAQIKKVVTQYLKRYVHTTGPYMFAVVNIAVAGHRTRGAPPLQHPPLHAQHPRANFRYRLEHMRRLGS